MATSANKTLSAQSVLEVDTTQRMPLGAKMRFPSSTGLPREFLYVKAGDEALTVGQVCLIHHDGTTVLLDSDLAGSMTGPVAVAMGTVAAASYAWVQIRGPGTVVSGDVASGAAVYATSTAGSVDDAAADGMQVLGMRFTADDSGGFATVEMDYPWAGDVDTHA